MKDAHYYRLKETKYLTTTEVHLMCYRMKEELRLVTNRTLRKSERALMAWFLREYCYLPFSLIAKVLGYRKSANCRESVVRITNRFRERGTWPPHDPETHDCFEVFMSVASDEYDIDNIALSDMVLEEDQEHALWAASQVCGHTDKRSSPGCKATPKHSQLEMVETAVWQLNHTMEDIYSICEKYYLLPHDS